jgi:hypothetical protein
MLNSRLFILPLNISGEEEKSRKMSEGEKTLMND